MLNNVKFRFLSGKKSIILLTVFALVLGNVTGQITITLQPDSTDGKDAIVWYLSNQAGQYGPTNIKNYGNYPFYQAEEWTFQGDPGTRYGLLDFNLSQIPVGSNVISSYLSLYGHGDTQEDHSSLSGSNESILSRIVDPWDEWTVTWDNQPGTSTINEVTLPQSISSDQNYLNIDVTLMVQDMVDNPSIGHGFKMQVKSTQYYRRMGFCSSDYADTTKHPKLEITYVPSVGVSETIERSNLNIHPNPTDGKFKVEGLKFGVEKVEVYDLFGRKVLESKEPEVDMSSYPAGLYIWRVGEVRGKLVIE